MKWLRRAFLFLLCVVAFLLAILAVNQDQVALRFLDYQTEAVSLFWWLLMAFGGGFLLGLGVAVLMTVRGAARNRSLTKQLKVHEKELNQLKRLSPAE